MRQLRMSSMSPLSAAPSRFTRTQDLIVEGLKRGQAYIAVPSTQGIDDKNPLDFEEYVESQIEHGLCDFEGRFAVGPLPKISHLFYGRDVGCVVERIDLGLSIDNMSAMEVRKRLLAS
jgi:adenylylsulfate kinase